MIRVTGVCAPAGGANDSATKAAMRKRRGRIGGEVGRNGSAAPRLGGYTNEETTASEMLAARRTSTEGGKVAQASGLLRRTLQAGGLRYHWSALALTRGGVFKEPGRPRPED